MDAFKLIEKKKRERERERERERGREGTSIDGLSFLVGKKYRKYFSFSHLCLVGSIKVEGWKTFLFG